MGGTAPIPIASSTLEPPGVASSGSVSPAPFSVSPLTPENGHRSRKGRAPSPPRPSQPSTLRLNGGRSGHQACANSPLPSPWVEESLNATVSHWELPLALHITADMSERRRNKRDRKFVRVRGGGGGEGRRRRSLVCTLRPLCSVQCS